MHAALCGNTRCPSLQGVQGFQPKCGNTFFHPAELPALQLCLLEHAEQAFSSSQGSSSPTSPTPCCLVHATRPLPKINWDLLWSPDKNLFRARAVCFLFLKNKGMVGRSLEATQIVFCICFKSALQEGGEGALSPPCVWKHKTNLLKPGRSLADSSADNPQGCHCRNVLCQNWYRKDGMTDGFQFSHCEIWYADWHWNCPFFLGGGGGSRHSVHISELSSKTF